MANSYLQVRVEDSDKEKAGEILEGLGTNLSMVINMLLKQIILTRGIPFEVKMNRSFSKDEFLSEMLFDYVKRATPEEREAIRKALTSE